ncbi:helix-turn-helix transcriptional regulator [Prevotella melaninogenica]|uniref:Helix-turn-helix transcriptional regulator n=1 Tax=Prevotella melaninogenica TaxID=28132 RepID=A0ABX7XQF9_9BACT|nr:XRE family transcriptional regulator [Prevotella melaninogenica]QUB75835.1 helix-turn-helix transcriptional regulator [Prevotella melaninogenica]
MEEAIKQIGERLKGLREALDISVQEMAETCGISEEKYLKMETGESELSVSKLYKVSRKYGISLDALMFGEEPRMNSYFLTRKGKGMSVERKYAYKYQSLASGFSGRRADPFLVTVEPKPEDAPVNMDIHPGQEFNMVWEGRMDLRLGDKRFILEPGDCIYFDANQPHCMRALDNVPMRFLAIIF